MADEHKKALIANCSTKADIQMPLFDSQTPANTGKARAITPETGGENDIETTGSLEHDGEETDDEEVWDLVKIIGADALLTDCPIKCSTDACLLPAACVYVSSHAPTQKWYTCLDCQVSLPRIKRYHRRLKLTIHVCCNKGKRLRWMA